MARFAILHHRAPQGEHWDLMLERGDVLLTWQLSRDPGDGACLPIPARRIQNHRTHYLDYEGPISGDRGVVTRVDRGCVEFSKVTDRECAFKLTGGTLCGAFAVVLVTKETDWELRRPG